MPLTQKARECLSDRQIWLYEYIEGTNATDPSRWVGIDSIVFANQLMYGGSDAYTVSDNPKSHNPCPSVWSDKEAINACPFVDAPILYNNYMLKLPSSVAEAKEFYTNELVRKAKKMLWRAGLCLEKVRSNGQMTIDVDEDGNPTERFINSIVESMSQNVADTTIGG